MELYSFEAKTEEEAKAKALSELGIKEDEILLKTTTDNETGFFKSKKVVCEVLKKDEVLNYIKELLKEIGSLMNLEINVEYKKRENYLKINLITNNNNIIIGKNGSTIDALQRVLKQAIYAKTGFFVNLIVDVGDYKERQLDSIKKQSLIMAAKAFKTKKEIKLPVMNSFKRRLVHEALLNYEGVQTKSIGEEPNRYVIIKPEELSD